MTLAMTLPAALRASSAAKICREPPFLKISNRRIHSSDPVKGAFCFSSLSGELRDSPSLVEAVGPTDPVWRRANYKTVRVLPLHCYPLFPSNNIFTVKDPVLLASLNKDKKTGVFVAGAFLLKGNCLEQDITSLKGKEFLNYLHQVGSLVQVRRIQEDEVRLRAHCRVQITDMVEEDPLTVRVRIPCSKVDTKYDGYYDIVGRIYDNFEWKLDMDTRIFKFKLLSDMDFCEASNARDIVAAQMIKGDYSYEGACADELLSIMNLCKWRKQKLLEELDVLRKICLVDNLSMNHIEYKRFEDALGTLDFDFDELLMYHEEKVSKQPNILSECRAIIPDILEKAKVRDGQSIRGRESKRHLQ